MSKKSEPPLWIDVNQSPYLLSFIIVVHSIAIITCLMLPLTFALIVLILLLPVSSLYLYLQRYRRGFYTLSLKYSAEFSWELIEGDHYSSMRILKSSVLTSFIIVLHTEIDNKRRNLLVCRDAVLGDKYRQLFVALKIMKLE
ncbi:MAG TPA: hypothetical protein EYQ43_06225 [Methyloprofundus sp.]|uniref:protein YgfX n=1 Tax=Methyloprofundus sp. TaxID=2020875 RepID=UPI0017D9D63D|nr:protein YgfX [Methyloprofundus sp.]HIG65145.1 hypothetical protein [Methyloprofundus sp.]